MEDISWFQKKILKSCHLCQSKVDLVVVGEEDKILGELLPESRHRRQVLLKQAHDHHSSTGHLSLLWFKYLGIVHPQEVLVDGQSAGDGHLWSVPEKREMGKMGNMQYEQYWQFHFLQLSSSYRPPVFIIGEHGDGKQIGPHLQISSSTRRDGGGGDGGVGDVGGDGGRRCRRRREKSENECVAEKRCHHNTWMSSQDFSKHKKVCFIKELSNTTAKQDSGF